MLQPPARHPPRAEAAEAEVRPARVLRWPHALRFAGPGLLVAAGYMDPGNWATSLAGGSRFGLALLCVVVFASLVAMLFQAAAVRLGLGIDMDLAQACRAHFPRPVTVLLWLLCEIAIIACNVAELLGTAIALQMLFDIPLRYAVVVAAADVAAILALQHFGYRYLEAFVIALVLVVGACFALQLSWLDLGAPQTWAAALPTRQWLQDPQMLYIAVGIVGATVMPHNL